MAMLLESNNELLTENNLIGRLTFGDIGLDLMEANDPLADKYLKACMSIFTEPSEDSNSGGRLVSILRSRRNKQAEELLTKFSELEVLMKRIYLEKNKSEIPDAQKLIEAIL